MRESADAALLAGQYHDRTKHRLDRYAAGPGTLDWDAQPDPFRHWPGGGSVALPRTPPASDVPWPRLDAPRPPAPLNAASLAEWLRLACAITAWKQYGDSRWALRAHPSSGNLHPTETWLMLAGLPDLADGLYHYQARDHSLERRAGHPGATAPAGVWLGFSSVPWREAWKYGERAFRYCQLDLGHVLAATAYAAALLGWRPRLLACPPDILATALGLDREADFSGVEAEEAEVLLALTPATPDTPPAWRDWYGKPSLLDPRPMYQWPILESVARATRGPLPGEAVAAAPDGGGIGREEAGDAAGESIPASRVILQRRSAQAFDGQSVMPAALLHRLLAGLLPGGAPVWRVWPVPPRVHPILLVHRVDGLAPGLYALPRREDARAGLAEALRPDFAWERVLPDLPLFKLAGGRAGNLARTLSCHQDIARDGAVTFMFLAEFARPLAENPAAYRHLHWEAGMLGHVLGLEAEAAGWRGTGIGCFFDDADHEALGLADARWQVLYHYAVGRALVDPRLATLPAYG